MECCAANDGRLDFHNLPRIQVSDESFITRAYLTLPSAPRSKYGERTISLVRIRNYEIRMVETTPPIKTALFWIELFDHNLKTTIDSCHCTDIEEAVAAYEHLVSQTNDEG
jgi:hypothetical protein